VRTVLVVEDDNDLRFMLKLLLERAGYQVQEAAHGMGALHRISESVPDLIVTDIKMPILNGSDLIRRLREQEKTADLPIVVVSAYAVLPETASLADAIIAKPFAPEHIVDVVAKLIGGRPPSDPTSQQTGP